jgi:hypothetical protein
LPTDEYELYNITDDRNETKNIMSDGPVGTAMKKPLRDHEAGSEPESSPKKKETELDEETQDQLKALGYI